jgi:hypothetical protein
MSSSKEGYLLKYANFVRGYKKCYCQIKQNFFIIQRNKKNVEGRFKIDLRDDISVEWSHKDNTEITLTLSPNQKPNKIFFKAKDETERDAWLKALNDVIDKAELELAQSNHTSEDNSLVIPHKEAIYNAFSSKFFVDECDLDHKF